MKTYVTKYFKMIQNSLNFSELPTQTAIESTQLVEVSSLTSFPQDVSSNTPIEFRVDPSDNYLDLAKTYLHVRIRIGHVGGVELSEDFTTTINNLAQTMWRNVELYISDEPVTRDVSTYPWMSYIHHLTHTPATLRNSAMTASFFYKDDNPNFWETDKITGGTIKRQTVVLEKKGGPLELYSQVMFDFTALPHFIPSQTELTMRFVPAAAGICLASSAAPPLELTILSAKLYVTKVRLQSAALQKYNKLLSSHGLVYETDRYQTFTKTAAKADQNIEWHLSVEKMPKRLYLFQVDQAAYNGAQKLNIFNFELFDLRSVQVFANDLSLPANVPSNVESQLSAAFYQSSKAVANSAAWDMTIDDYMNGHFIYVVDLTPDSSASAEYKSQEKKGSITIKLDYKMPLKQPIVIFCMTETRYKMMIDGEHRAKWLHA